MDQLTLQFEVTDRADSRILKGWLELITKAPPDGVVKIAEQKGTGTLEAADWHFLSLLVGFGAGIGAGAASEIGKLSVKAVVKLLVKLRDYATTKEQSSSTPASWSTVVTFGPGDEATNFRLDTETSDREIQRAVEANMGSQE